MMIYSLVAGWILTNFVALRVHVCPVSQQQLGHIDVPARHSEQQRGHPVVVALALALSSAHRADAHARRDFFSPV